MSLYTILVTAIHVFLSCQYLTPCWMPDCFWGFFVQPPPGILPGVVDLGIFCSRAAPSLPSSVLLRSSSDLPSLAIGRIWSHQSSYLSVVHPIEGFSSHDGSSSSFSSIFHCLKHLPDVFLELGCIILSSGFNAPLPPSIGLLYSLWRLVDQFAVGLWAYAEQQ
ncbi:hypothetical protein XENORESO_020174 [Xenotaenia resolanae]|uniref:Cytochrome c biogenesis B n=1 Tax=Xenotaenia resolanae TaxID=208358 RepID=A0ABV0W4S3_9TELE